MRREPPRPPVPELPAMRPAARLAAERVPDDPVRGIGRRNEELSTAWHLPLQPDRGLDAGRGALMATTCRSPSVSSDTGSARRRSSGAARHGVRRRRAAGGDEELPASDG